MIFIFFSILFLVVGCSKNETVESNLALPEDIPDFVQKKIGPGSPLGEPGSSQVGLWPIRCVATVVSYLVEKVDGEYLPQFFSNSLLTPSLRPLHIVSIFRVRREGKH